MKTQATGQVMDFTDYLTILRRRRTSILITGVLVMAVSAALAFLLPPVYHSEATILIEQQEIPREFVATTVTGYLQERIEGIRQRLLTGKNLWVIAEKLDLYPERRKTDDRREFVEEMKENIFIEMVDVKATNPDSTKPFTATIAFTLAFEGNTPQVAKRVARELTSLYLEENRRSRSEQAAQVSEFLEAEAKRLGERITQHEEKLAEFKQENFGQLPELANLNLRLMEQTEAKVERTEENMRALGDQIAALSAQLSYTKPNQDIFTDQGQRVTSANERLSMLNSQYLSLSSKYASNHPDLVKLRREISSLESQSGGSGGAGQIVQKLAGAQNELREALQKYAPDHPDVKKLQQRVASLERAMRDAPNLLPATPTQRTIRTVDNPAYVTLQTQIATANANLRAEQTKLVQLNQKLSEYEARLTQTPEVERGYLDLTRDYDNARKKYGEIQEKLSEAKLAEELERDQKAERFTVTQPAFLPTLPIRPNRLGIALLGFVLAAGTGLGVASIREYFDRAIYGIKGIRGIFEAPPLATIPYIQNQADVTSAKRHKWMVASFVSTLTVIIAVALVQLYL